MSITVSVISLSLTMLMSVSAATGASLGTHEKRINTPKTQANPLEVLMGNVALSARSAAAHGANGTDGFGIIPVPTLYTIGDVGPAGGWVFYITDGGLHGLEAAPEDQNGGNRAQWGCYAEVVPGTFGAAVGTGSSNTDLILAHSCSITPRYGSKTHDAALHVKAYSLNGHNDWFLPSRDELHLMYNNLPNNEYRSFASSYYWSSSRFSAYDAPILNFADGVKTSASKYFPVSVRAVRAF